MKILKLYTGRLYGKKTYISHIIYNDEKYVRIAVDNNILSGIWKNKHNDIDNNLKKELDEIYYNSLYKKYSFDDIKIKNIENKYYGEINGHKLFWGIQTKYYSFFNKKDLLEKAIPLLNSLNNIHIEEFKHGNDSLKYNFLGTC